MKLLKLSLLLFFAASLASAQSIPAVKAKALDNSEVTIPGGTQQALILVVGFSHKSGDPSQVWEKKISADYHADNRVGYYILPVLQSAPSFVRPMILRGMRKDTPEPELSHFVPLYSKEEEWKKVAQFSAPDDPYLIVASPDGHVTWQGHGTYSDALYAEIKNAVAPLVGK